MKVYYTLTQAAVELEVSRYTVQKYCAHLGIRFVTKNNRMTIHKDDVNKIDVELSKKYEG